MKETDTTGNNKKIKRFKCSKVLGVSELSKRISSKDNANVSPLPIAPIHLPSAHDCYSTSLCLLPAPDRVLNRASTTRLRGCEVGGGGGHRVVIILSTLVLVNLFDNA
jgi:hypothetical protein